MYGTAYKMLKVISESLWKVKVFFDIPYRMHIKVLGTEVQNKVLKKLITGCNILHGWLRDRVTFFHNNETTKPWWNVCSIKFTCVEIKRKVMTSTEQNLPHSHWGGFCVNPSRKYCIKHHLIMCSIVEISALQSHVWSCPHLRCQLYYICILLYQSD